MPAPVAVAECGTVSAYKGHRRRKEQVDQACYAAWNNQMTEYRASRAGRELAPRPATNEIEHGTVRGYRRCAERAKVSRGSTCEPCKAAWRAHRNNLKGTVGRAEDFFFTVEPVPAGVPACTASNVDPEWFFSLEQRDVPEWTDRQVRNRNAQASRRAKKICDTCTLREECLQQGAEERFGIFGGMTRLERLGLQGLDTEPTEAPIFLESM